VNAESKVERLITPHEEYLRLGSDPSGRRQAYRALFKAHRDAGLIDQI
jgi:putative transposase